MALTEREALDLAIWAISTWLDPGEATDEWFEYFDEFSQEAIDTLLDIRNKLGGDSNG